MTKRILLAATTMALLMSGCAQKTVSTGVDATGTEYGEGDGTLAYQNVDPNANGVYGAGKGTYDNSTAYANGGVESVYFDVDQYTITSEKLAIIANNASMLKNDIAQGAKLKLEGHCDATGTDEYNYALGLRRANAAKDALVMKGINAGSISLVSMGESSPECSTGTSSDCYSKNRRVEFKVVQ
ncbi:OmpA family protein [bacterium]|nr:OmpA family protein [bacterium]MBU1957938.1 OmpA family protein [bacterium]